MNNKIEYVLFFILIILLLMIITINSKKKVKLYEFFIEPTKTTVNNQNKNNQNKRVTIASLKNTEIEENTEQEEDTTEKEDTVKPVNSKLSKCPEGYAFQQNRCEKVCHHCKLGKCEYGICY